MKRVKFVGLDVHAETIAIAIADQDGEVRWLGVIPNREDSVRNWSERVPAASRIR
jgi:transposase